MVYYIPSEVANHNHLEDCWVVIRNDVYDLTPLLVKNRGTLIDPIVKMAGQDISHWFDANKDIKTHIDPIRQVHVPYLPMGTFLGIPPNDPNSDWDFSESIPWWKDETFVVGQLSRRTRKIRIMNTLTSTNSILSVCEEHTIRDIQEKYREQNSHCESYTWKALQEREEKKSEEEEDPLVFVKLDMDKTLEENGLKDDSEVFEELGLNEDEFLPEIFLYFNDDLTEA